MSQGIWWPASAEKDEEMAYLWPTPSFSPICIIQASKIVLIAYSINGNQHSHYHKYYYCFYNVIVIYKDKFPL